ncbi:MAG: hypothetical protein H6Q33_2774 [Deltaproteobacteria bacterium]|jgi:hypothetical protein|nr:hypothetical protein [Deltaproteobacteria bacterium]
MQLTYDQALGEADRLALRGTSEVSAIVRTLAVLISVAFWSVVAWRLWPVLS